MNANQIYGGTETGIVVVTSGYTPVYCNQEGDRIIKRIHRAHGTRAAPTLPLEVLTLCLELNTQRKGLVYPGGIAGPLVRYLHQKGPGILRLRGYRFWKEGETTPHGFLVIFTESPAGMPRSTIAL